MDINKPSLLIRVDAGEKVGAGHLMRCLALAQAWKRRGGAAVFAARSCPVPLRRRIESEGFGFESISSDEEIAGLARGFGAGWVVLDGYGFGCDLQAAIRLSGLKVLVVDDYAHLPRYDADAILNQNIGATADLYAGKAPGARILAGTKFALLREEFARAQTARPEVSDPLRVLVTVGGADPDNATGRLLSVLGRISRPLEVRALIGAAFLHGEAVAAAAEELPHPCEVLTEVTDMVAQFSWADFALTAAGSTQWERCRMGVPGAMVVIAENQIAIAKGIESCGAGIDLGWHRDIDASQAAAQIDAALSSERTLSEIGRIASRLADGLGAQRVAGLLAGVRLFVRKATLEDERRYFDWVNDPGVRRNSFSQTPIEYPAHQAWFQRCLASPGSQLFVAEDWHGVAAGQIRFDWSNEEQAWAIDYSLDETRRGEGLASELLVEGLVAHRSERADATKVVAYVKLGNLPSARALERAGFVVGDSPESVARDGAIRFCAGLNTPFAPGVL